MIGTPKFMEDDCVGLAEEESGIDLSWLMFYHPILKVIILT